ncbi:MAG TPA: choice-of-anchor L domain-containing protein, partial [Myxococcota bacterium]|nr:choice-of-anchor L domain-containing protein [Myxococcota bacterium]
MRKTWLLAFSLALAAGPASAISVVPTSDETALQNAIFGSLAGLTVTDFSVSGHTEMFSGDQSTGTYTNASGTYGIGPGVVISTGHAGNYGDGPNAEGGLSTAYFIAATAADDLLLDPITPIDPNTSEPFDHFDVTRIDITFDASPDVANVFFTIVFGSEEFNEFIGSDFIDTFGIYFNGTNIALVGGEPVNINHPDVSNIAGTELDGLIAPGGDPLLLFQVPVTPGSSGNTLTFIVADTSDEIFDTTVYISGVGSVDPVPEPAVTALLLAGAAALAL